MIKLLKKIVHRLSVGERPEPRLHPELTHVSNLVEIGSAGCSWTVPDSFLHADSVCYLAGAGEDISFDIGLVNKYNISVHIFDPTPRAKVHFNELVKHVSNDIDFPINHNDTEYYSIEKDKLSQLNFHNFGLWDKQDEIKFYAPKNPDHVSHSALNLQHTDDFFLAKVNRLSSIMHTNNHDHIDLLKIDIEGAEYKVLESIVQDKLDIKVLCVEYDESHSPLDEHWESRIKSSVDQLRQYGYAVVADDGHHNYTFVLQRLIGSTIN